MDISRTYAYICEIPSELRLCDVFPSERNDEIQKTANEKLRAEKYFAWRLLEYAISKLLKKTMQEISFKKGDNGRWSAEGFDFSLSHSNGVVAVVISDSAVGIDIEQVSAPKSKSFARRIFSDGEYSEFLSIPSEKREEYLAKKWTEKEAVFKSRNLSAFIPRQTAAENGEKVKTEFFTIGDKRYFCSVCSLQAIANAEIVDLKK